MTAYQPTPFNFALVPTHTPEELLSNVRYALSLGLTDLQPANPPNDWVMSIAGGGPSLEDTYPQLEGCIAAVNGSLGYLNSKGVKPNLCGICHPKDDIVDQVVADPEVTYFVGSCVHPRMFDKLLAANCKVILWHVHPIDGLDELLNEHYPNGWVQIPGGTTMGLRWITLGYHLGFRKFHLHGLDSSFRTGSHAYPHHQDQKEWITYDGYKTRIPFLGQVEDFLSLMEDGMALDDPPEITMFGDGLLQWRYKHWLESNQPLVWPKSDEHGRGYMLRERHTIAEFMKLLPNRGTVIQAGGNVGLYARGLSRYFDQVLTFEPNAENFACLLQNTAGHPNIRAKRFALGEFNGHVGTKMNQEGHCGTYYITEGNEAAVMPIDELHLDECDLIWLDIEGYEEKALRGAVKTIEKFKPAIIIEENPNQMAEKHGLKSMGARGWLEKKQYRRVTKIQYDCLYVYGGP